MLPITLPLLLSTAALLGTTGYEVTVKIGEGESFTLQTSKRMDEDVVWLYGPLNPQTLIAQIYRSAINTEFSERLRDRLELNIHTGSLTILNATAQDSGIYHVEMPGVGVSRVKIFHCTVYAPVSKPVLSTTSQHVTDWPSAVLVECSVDNGREVTLSWYRGNELLNETTSPDNNMTLTLPLVVKKQDSAVYTCVAANPVNNQTVLLSIQEQGCGQDTQACSTIVWRLVLSALVVIIMTVLLVEHVIL